MILDYIKKKSAGKNVVTQMRYCKPAKKSAVNYCRSHPGCKNPFLMEGGK